MTTEMKVCTVEFKPSFTSKLFIIILEKHLKNTLMFLNCVLSFPLSWGYGRINRDI